MGQQGALFWSWTPFQEMPYPSQGRKWLPKTGGGASSNAALLFCQKVRGGNCPLPPAPHFTYVPASNFRMHFLTFFLFGLTVLANFLWSRIWVLNMQLYKASDYIACLNSLVNEVVKEFSFLSYFGLLLCPCLPLQSRAAWGS